MITKAPSNTNAPRVALQGTGDGAVLYRTLARVLVRQLIAEATNPLIDDRETWPVAG